MRISQSTKFFLLLLALPIVVAAFGFGVTGAVVLVLIWLVVRWLFTLRGLKPGGQDALLLESIPISHFVEKVRWCLDQAEIDYVEQKNGGTLGAFFAGRTVPRLWARTGSVWTSIGNSPEILRFLWGHYGHQNPERRQFLEPSTESVELENRFDTYGRDLQIWVYWHLLPSRELSLRAWGADDPGVPGFHRLLLNVLFPVLRALIRRAFSITRSNFDRSKLRIESLLADMNAHLENQEFLIGTKRSYVDYTFAAMTALWVFPPEYANGAAFYERIEIEQWPQAFQDDVNAWRSAYPHAVAFVETLYKNERSRSTHHQGNTL